MTTISPITPFTTSTVPNRGPSPLLDNTKPNEPDDSKLREAFQDFTAGTVFGQMLKSLRKLNDKPAYLHGGQAEETFRNLLDEKVAGTLARSHGATIAEPLFRSFATPPPALP